MAFSHKQGVAAEQQAARFLVSQGLTVIQRNYRLKVGELDIICRDGQVWVCVEVKFRQRLAHGHPIETIDKKKLNRMVAAFNLYLMDNKLNPAHTPMRFDIIAIHGGELTWLKNVTN